MLFLFILDFFLMWFLVLFFIWGVKGWILKYMKEVKNVFCDGKVCFRILNYWSKILLVVFIKNYWIKLKVIKKFKVLFIELNYFVD